MNSNKCMRNAFYSRLDIVLKGNVYNDVTVAYKIEYFVYPSKVLIGLEENSSHV